MFPTQSRNVPMDFSGDGAFKQRYTRRRFRGRFRGRRNLGRQALKEVRQVKRTLNKTVVRKNKTTSLAALALASQTAQENSMVTMARGDTKFLREGDKISLIGMSWRLNIALNAAETSPATVRFVVVYDRNPVGAQAAFEEVYNAQRTWALINTAEEFAGRFQVMHDQMWSLGPNGKDCAVEKGYLDLKKKPVIYDNNVGDITDVQRGNLFCAFISQGNAENVGVNGYIRLFFIDTA